MARRSDIDWELIEMDYRVGQLTIRMMGTKFGVDPSSITRRAKKMSWRRGDLIPFVRELTCAVLRHDREAEQRVYEKVRRYQDIAPNREALW